VSPAFARVRVFTGGWTTPAAVEEFLNPDLSRLHDPFALPDMDVAVARLARAVEAGEPRYASYGDYDVDGITAVALSRVGACAPPMPTSTTTSRTG